MELTMSNYQTINFLEAALVFLLLTNAASIMLAAWAVRLLMAWRPRTAAATSGLARRLEAILVRPS
jgi:hypothetical protein